MSGQDVLEITSEEAVAALTAQAFHEQPGDDDYRKAVEAALSLTRNTEGDDLDPGAEIPVGEISRVIHDALGEQRVIVHCMLDAPGMVIGADWDLADAVALCQRTDRFAWTPGPARHDLAVIADGKVYRFDVRREVTR
jgi:hypothetical protein